MKNILLFLLINSTGIISSYCQLNVPDDSQRKALIALIDQYSNAREKNDTALLKEILTNDVDQLASSGEWRMGIGAAIQGMLKSSLNNPGIRTLRVETIRMFNPTTAIVDCRYEIKNEDASVRKMWSSFIVVMESKKWKISAIRNMMPTNP